MAYEPRGDHGGPGPAHDGGFVRARGRRKYSALIPSTGAHLDLQVGICTVATGYIATPTY